MIQRRWTDCSARVADRSVGAAQAGDGDGEEAADRGLRSDLPGGRESVEAVAGQLVSRDVLAYGAGVGGRGDQVADHVVQLAFGAGDAFAAVQEGGELVVGVAVGFVDDEGVGLEDGFESRLGVVSADQGRTVLVSSHLLAEVAQVVDRVVIVAGGRLVTEKEVATVTGSRVLVRVDQPSAMSAALAAVGVDHEILGDGAISVAGTDPGEVGAIAQRAGVTVTELSRQSAGETLEAMFLAATGGAR